MRYRIRKNKIPKERQQQLQESELQEKSQEETNVVNISDCLLTPAQTRMLSKGLSFCPSTHLNWFQLELDLTQFFRKLKLKVNFSNFSVPVNANVVPKTELWLKMFNLSLGSDFVPAGNFHPLETFMELVRNDFE